MKVSLFAQSQMLDVPLRILRHQVICMASKTQLLTRRSFSSWLAASGCILNTAHWSHAQESFESEPYFPLGVENSPRTHVADEFNSQERWIAAENERWQWYERESLVNGQWKMTGVTTPVHRETGKCVEALPGYLNESLVPPEYRRVSQRVQPGHPVVVRSELPHAPESFDPGAFDPGAFGQVSLERRAQDGRPPSEWLRSMEVEELRDWLAKIEVSEAGVHGMTFWTHLIRDHMFRPLLIKGLTEPEQAKLHAAAHFGY